MHMMKVVQRQVDQEREREEKAADRILDTAGRSGIRIPQVVGRVQKLTQDSGSQNMPIFLDNFQPSR